MLCEGYVAILNSMFGTVQLLVNACGMMRWQGDSRISKNRDPAAVLLRRKPSRWRASSKSRPTNSSPQINGGASGSRGACRKSTLDSYLQVEVCPVFTFAREEIIVHYSISFAYCIGFSALAK